MASRLGFTTSPFSETVVTCMQRLYPESLADKSFDNTGLLLEAPLNRSRQLRNSVLLAIDLTQAVAAEAIEGGHSVVIAYHPIIFRGLKALNSKNTQQQTLIRLAAEGISVYCPHTAVDAVPGGMADWLCDIVTRNDTQSPQILSGTEPRSQVSDKFHPPPLPPRVDLQATTPQSISHAPRSPSQQPNTHPKVPHSRDTIIPNPSPPPGFEGAGMGRFISFPQPQSLTSIIQRIAPSLKTSPQSPGFPIAVPQGTVISDMTIRTVATCPGSGSSLLMRDGKPVADLLLTGEMSHHEALAAIENGSAVISLFHSNSERGYLREVMLNRLESELRVEWGRKIEELADLPDIESQGIFAIINDPSVEVKISEQDRDPYVVIPWSAGTS